MSQDLSLTTIRKLFEKQIKALTMKTCGIQKECNLESFDIQFSDRWLK